MLKIHDIKKGKEIQEEVWCTRCRTEGHYKDSCPTLFNYLASGASNPINSQGIPWCQIFHMRGHQSEECLYLVKIVSAPSKLYYKFFRSMGHEDKDL